MSARYAVLACVALLEEVMTRERKSYIRKNSVFAWLCWAFIERRNRGKKIAKGKITLFTPSFNI